jgi:hypothetical protein
MGLSIGIGATIEQARTWQIDNNLFFPVLSDSSQETTSLFTLAAPWVALIDDEQIVQYTDVSIVDSTPGLLITILDTLWTPEIGASVSNISFGQVELGQSADFQFYLNNIRTGVLFVESATIQDSAFAIDFAPDSIFAVDDSMMITVTFSPNRTGNISDTLYIESDGGFLAIPVSGSGFSSAVEPQSQVPLRQFRLSAIYPNPFNNVAMISFNIPQDGWIRLEVLDISGGIVALLQDNYLSSGEYSMVFEGNTLPSGLYFCRLLSGGETDIRKMILLK